MRKLIFWGAAVMVLGFVCASIATFVRHWHGWTPTVIEGVVLREDNDVRKQVPVSRAEVTATNGRFETTVATDPAGHFKLEIKTGWHAEGTIKLLVRHLNYSSFEVLKATGSKLYLLYLQPKDISRGSTGANRTVPIADVRIRYAVKTTTTANIGSAAPTFDAPGTKGVPCDGHLPCSPDGKWKAISSTQPFDAGERAEFRNARLSCIAGPCPFTKVTTSDLINPARFINVTVDNWSSTATFLMEAEVTRTTASEMVLEAYPVIFGSAMNFTLPATAEGPSAEASMDGQDIVFPLGPELNLSWAECSSQPMAENAQQYRCILKPGYQFR